MSKRKSCFSLATLTATAPLPSRKFAAAAQALIGAFKSLHGQDGAFLDDDRLADFQPGNFLGDAKAESDVLLLRVGQSGAERKTGGGHERPEPGHGFDQA